MGKIISSLIYTPLKQVAHPKGKIFHALRKSEECFSEFGEAYFTAINTAETKGWKKHTLMRINLIVPVGKVLFHIHDEYTGTTKNYTLSPEENYGRLTVPPLYWVAFTGLGPGVNIILNIASIEHSPDEAMNAPLETFAL